MELKDKYPHVDNSLRCPKCETRSFDLTFDYSEDECAIFRARCIECDAEWTEVYTLRFRDFDDEEGDYAGGFDFDDNAWVE